MSEVKSNDRLNELRNKFPEKELGAAMMRHCSIGRWGSDSAFFAAIAKSNELENLFILLYGRDYIYSGYIEHIEELIKQATND